MTDPNQPDSPVPSPEAATETSAQSPARRPRRRRTPKVDAADGAPADVGTEGAADAGPSAVTEADSTSADQGAGPRPDAEGGEPRRKRHRNRRRNRRDGREGRRGDEGPREGEGPSAEGADAAADGPPSVNLPSTDVNELFAAVVSGVYDITADAEAPPPELQTGSVAESALKGPPTVDIPLDLPSVSETQPSVDDTAQAALAQPGADEPSLQAPLAQDQGSLPDSDGGSVSAPSDSQAASGRDDNRRVLAPDAEAPKLQKVLAQSGVGSRRDLEQMIADGRIAVNGQPAHVGQRIRLGDRITLDGKPVRVRIAPPVPRVLAYHKPVGEVVTYDDPQARPTVFRRLPRLQHGKWQSVGRLDINTEGLLLFTNSGDLANRLMHPRFGVEREYAVRVLGTLTEEEREKLLQGVPIEGQTAAFQSITDGGGEGANHWYRVVITEGRNREVRKLFDSVDKAVSRLIRIRYGSVVLPRGLRRGVWVDLGVDDLKALQEATGMPARHAKGAGRGANQAGPGGPREARGGPDDERRGSKRNARGRDKRRGDPQQPRPQGQRAQSFVPDFDDNENLDNIGPIPDPLQQTYDKRAFQQSRRQTREYGEDGPIPNPLQQTYDKRAIQSERRPQREFSEDGPIPNPLQQTYDKRFASSPKPGGSKPGGGRGRKPPGNAPRKSAAGGQPDPMRTAVGYIGGDAFRNKQQRGGGRGGRGGPKTGGGGGAGGGRGRGGPGR